MVWLPSNKQHQKGVFLLELLVVLAMVSVMLGATTLFISTSREAVFKAGQRQVASAMARQQLEQVKDIWQRQWSSLVDGTWHIVKTGPDWTLAANSASDGIYTKQIDIMPVYRNIAGEIDDEGTYPDPSSKKIISTVSWSGQTNQVLNQEIILTNYLHHNVWLEDTFDDFSDGVEDATDFTTNPGYVQLAQTGGGGWSEPVSLGTVDGETKASGICTANDYIYLPQNKVGGGVEVFDIATDPVVPNSLGSFGVMYRPNDCTVIGNTLYVSNNLYFFPSVSIYDLSIDPVHPSYTGSTVVIFQAEGIWATDNYLYITANNWPIIMVYDIAGNKKNNPQYIGTFFTNADTVDVAVSGNYLYLVQESTAYALRIYDLSTDPADPTLVSSISTLYEPTGVWTESNILYISMKQKRGAMFSLQSDPTNPQILGYFPTERNTADIAAQGDYGYVAGADSQLKVIEVFDLSDSKGLSGTYFVYGEYTSSTFDIGSLVSSYRLSWEGNAPGGTQILMQTAVNNDDLTWNYVGPDGTSYSYFTDPGAVYFPESLGQYIRYKIILTGDGNQTPVVDKVVVTYAQ